MLFLGSNYASFMNGQVLVMDGGMQISSNGYREYAAFSKKMEDQQVYHK
jgi:hypothetical protein